MTQFWFMRHPGHGGGGWIQCLCNNHPAGMSCIGEIHDDECLCIESRGLMDQRGEIVVQFFEDRLYYKDVSIGIVKSFTGTDTRFAKAHGEVREVQLVYNPRRRFVEKGRRKRKIAARWYQQTHGREMVSEAAQIEAVCAYFIEHFFDKYLSQVESMGLPIIRLEDLNLSLKLGTGYFARFMEWLTGTEWPASLVDRIRSYNTPAYNYDNWLEWESPPFGGRVCKVVTVQQTNMTWSDRDNWDPDPTVARYWANRTPLEREIWTREAKALEKALGYNQGGEIGTVDNWRYRGEFPWGDVYE